MVNKDTNNLLGKKLKELRKAHSLKQDDIAEVLGVVRQTYSNYESGKRTPDSESLYKLAGLYNISIDDLMHLTIELDRNVYYDAPCPSTTAIELNEYLEYFNQPDIQKKFQLFSNTEKELFYYFQKLSDDDKFEMVEIAKIKARKNKPKPWF